MLDLNNKKVVRKEIKIVIDEMRTATLHDKNSTNK